jgi:DNA-binding NarL/FixJ family response regulator
VALIEAEVSVEAALSTLKLVRQQAPDVPVLIHPAGNDPGLRMQAFLLGACGLLPVCCSRRRYIQTIRMAACGNHVWSPRDTRDAEGLACGSR